MRAFLIVASSAILLMGCANSGDPRMAQAAVGGFHQRYNAGQLEQIYQNSSNEFKKKVKHGKFMGRLSSVRARYGEVTFSKFETQMVSNSLYGTRISLDYLTRTERGWIRENFMYIGYRDRVELTAYDVDTDPLF